MQDDDLDTKPSPPDMAWLLTFADLVSLLITFFVLLYSMKVVDAQQWENLRGSFSGVFSIRDPIVEAKPDQTDTVEKINPVQADNLDYLQRILSTRFRDNKVLKTATFSHDVERDTMTVTVPSSVLFASGSGELREEGLAALAQMGEQLRHIDNRIEISSHTDPTPVSSDDPAIATNWELAMARAVRVAHLMEERGVPGPIAAVSYGDSRFDEVAPDLPLVERHRLARRVDITIYGSKENEGI